MGRRKIKSEDYLTIRNCIQLSAKMMISEAILTFASHLGSLPILRCIADFSLSIPIFKTYKDLHCYVQTFVDA